MEPIPYSCQQISEDDIAAVVAVLRAPMLTQGPEVPAFEAAFAALHGGGEGVAVANATAALHLGCLAFGVGPGDRVWTSSNSFVASANAARYCGARIDFVDIDVDTRNMSVEKLAEKLAQAAREACLPKLVIPVDFAGLPCDLAEIRALADQYGFAILADSSHAVGASYQGKPLGDFADIRVFSFHAVKIITTGEGGMCLTRDPALAARLRRLRSHGITRDAAQMTSPPPGDWYYEQIELGYNYRMTDLQAALGRSQLSQLGERHAQRIALAARYDELLQKLPLKLPVRRADRVSAHHLYVVEILSNAPEHARARVFAALRADGIGANVHYIPIHLQPDYRALGFGKGDFSVTENYYDHAITIPLFPGLSAGQQDRVIASLQRALC